jgi:signal transduction histidine kinase
MSEGRVGDEAERPIRCRIARRNTVEARSRRIRDCVATATVLGAVLVTALPGAPAERIRSGVTLLAVAAAVFAFGRPPGSGAPSPDASPLLYQADRELLAENERRQDLSTQFADLLRSYEESRERARMNQRAMGGRTRREVATLRTENETLRERDRHRDEFVARVASGLGAPLAALGSYLEMLSRLAGEKHEVERSDVLAIARAEAARLSRLAADLLDVSRLRADRLEWSPEAAAIEPELEGAIESLASLAREHGRTVVLAPCEPRLVVFADRSRLRQILGNVLSSALGYGGHGSRIEVAAAMDGGFVAVAVATDDDGAGTAVADRESPFLPFARPDEHGGAAAHVSGLGLHLARELARRMGGELEVAASPRGGARFVLRLPELPADGYGAQTRRDQAPLSNREITSPAANLGEPR